MLASAGLTMPDDNGGERNLIYVSGFGFFAMKAIHSGEGRLWKRANILSHWVSSKIHASQSTTCHTAKVFLSLHAKRRAAARRGILCNFFVTRCPKTRASFETTLPIIGIKLRVSWEDTRSIAKPCDENSREALLQPLAPFQTAHTVHRRIECD